jgi:DHA1 family tetracycline resistance protein-like MFS transporter
MKDHFRASKYASCLLAIIVDSLGFGLVYPLFADLLSPGSTSVLNPETSIQLRQLILSIGFMMYPLGLFFGTSYLGDLSDIVGRKKVLLICMGGLFFSFLLMAFGASFKSLVLLFIGRGLSGLTSGAQPIAQASIADLSEKERKTSNLALMTITLSMGIVIGPLIGGFLSDKEISSFFTYSTPFYFSAFLALVAFVWIFISFEETFIGNKTKKIHPLRFIYLFNEALKHPLVRYLSILFILKELGMSIYYPFIAVHLKTTFNATNWQVGLFYTVLGIFMTLGILFTSKFLIRFFTTTTVSMISFFLSGIGMLVTGLTGNLSIIWMMTVFSGFAISCYNCLLAMYSNAVPKDSQGWVMGIAGASVSLSWILTSYIANLISVFGFIFIFCLAGSFLLLGALLHLPLKEKNHEIFFRF